MFNPRNAKSPEKMDKIEQLLGMEVKHVNITYAEPYPKFRSAKNTPMNEHEKNML